MTFVFTGFHQENHNRQFAFEGIAADHSRVKFTVITDLRLVHKYQIQMQELPLLCRHLLEDRPDTAPGSAITFTEEEMRGYATRRAAKRDEAAQKRKPWRKAPGAARGHAWRGPGN